MLSYVFRRCRILAVECILESGVCMMCQCCYKVEALPGKSVCLADLEAMRERAPRIRKERMARGQCLSCPEYLPQGYTGGVKCQNCKDKAYAKAKEKRKSKKESGLCTAKPSCKNIPPEGSVHCPECKKKFADIQFELKSVVITAYSPDATCSCCGEDDIRMLSIDHINNDGKERRASEGAGTNFYRWIIDNHFPDDLQVLCMGCNWGKYQNGGICPHQDGIGPVYPDLDPERLAIYKMGLDGRTRANKLISIEASKRPKMTARVNPNKTRNNGFRHPCPYCGSPKKTIKKHIENGVRRWYCKTCETSFLDTLSPKDESDSSAIIHPDNPNPESTKPDSEKEPIQYETPTL